MGFRRSIVAALTPVSRGGITSASMNCRSGDPWMIDTYRAARTFDRPTDNQIWSSLVGRSLKTCLARNSATLITARDVARLVMEFWTWVSVEVTYCDSWETRSSSVSVGRKTAETAD